LKEYLTDLAESLLSSYGYGGDDFDLHIKVKKSWGISTKRSPSA